MSSAEFKGEIEPIDYAKIGSSMAINEVVPKRKLRLIPFTQLGPDYKDLLQIQNTYIIIRKLNDSYEVLGSFAPHLDSKFRPLNDKERAVLQEAGL